MWGEHSQGMINCCTFPLESLLKERLVPGVPPERRVGSAGPSIAPLDGGADCFMVCKRGDVIWNFRCDSHGPECWVCPSKIDHAGPVGGSIGGQGEGEALSLRPFEKCGRPGGGRACGFPAGVSEVEIPCY